MQPLPQAAAAEQLGRRRPLKITGGKGGAEGAQQRAPGAAEGRQQQVGHRGGGDFKEVLELWVYM